MAKKSTKKLHATATVVPDDVVGPPPVNPEASLFRSMKQELEHEVREFRDRMVSKYKAFNGRDMRKEVAWYMEQLGLAINGDLERERLAERARLLEKTKRQEARKAKRSEK